MPMGYPFIFNGVQSELRNVSLVFIDNSYTNRPSGCDKSLVTASIRRKPTKQYLDTEYDNVLQFDIEIVYDQAVDIYELTDLKNWLTAPVGYEQLQICADNFDRFYKWKKLPLSQNTQEAMNMEYCDNNKCVSTLDKYKVNKKRRH